MQVSVFGLGYVGTVCAACLSDLRHKVIGVDANPTKVDVLRGGRAPIVERDIDKLVEGAVRQRGAVGYLIEYVAALFCEFVRAWRVHFTRGFDIIHACNPPDLIFIVGGFFKFMLNKRFVFDHHDLTPGTI
jgi:nucleoside-diphosphate-sugar epimerase